MTLKNWLSAVLFCVFVSPAFAAPTMTVTPSGVQSGNWTWDISITPDLSLVPDASGTPVALELGFRLTGAPLLGATISAPSQFDTANPGKVIFGWETLDPNAGNKPVGLQNHPSTGEVFAAYGSINFTTAGAKPFLHIVTQGALQNSTIEWLGSYSGKGRITQITGLTGSTYTTSNFDTFSGSSTQVVPEPASAALLATGGLVMAAGSRRRRSTCNARS